MLSAGSFARLAGRPVPPHRSVNQIRKIRVIRARALIRGIGVMRSHVRPIRGIRVIRAELILSAQVRVIRVPCANQSHPRDPRPCTQSAGSA